MRLTDREKKLIFAFLVVLVALAVWMYRWGRDDSSDREEEAFTLYEAKEDEASASPAVEGDELGGTIYVDIGGCVNRPGLYKLDRGARVKDGLTAAGGLTAEGDSSQINLAKKLNDEEKLYVPKRGESIPQGSPTEAASSKVSIQNGSKEELMTLPGIGEKTADKIIEYRTETPFQAVEDLKNVPGIGDKTFDSLKSNIQL